LDAPGGPLIGTAGWSLPLDEQAHFPGEGSHLERYARVLPAAEINSTFHRPHRESTFARWAESVPDGFRFSVKLPRTITHDAKLAGARDLLVAFLSQVAALGQKAACLLVQLPPRLAYDVGLARRFFGELRELHPGDVALEPRHVTWFTPEAERVLVDHRIARVAADPPRAANGMEPGGWDGLAYYRLHGSPRVYYSSYEDDFLDDIAWQLDQLRHAGIPAWCIFDNTTLGAGTTNALEIARRLT
jgi:uncharacterized protein YecE (DUF72 family)